MMMCLFFVFRIVLASFLLAESDHSMRTVYVVECIVLCRFYRRPS